MDSSTRAFTTIEYEHHEIHAGSHYYLNGYDTLQLNDTLTFYVEAQSGQVKEPHMTFQITGTNGVTVQIYEGSNSATLGSGGVTATIYNSNRNSTKTSVLTIYANPTAIVTTGTLIYSTVAGGTRVAGGHERSNELVFSTTDNYYIVLTSLSNSNFVGYGAEWYEHTPKDEIGDQW